MSCDIKGIGFSMGVTFLLNYVMITSYIEICQPNQESYFYFDRNVIAIRRIYDYLKLAVPSAIMFSSDWLGLQILILYSTYMDLASLTVNVSIFNFYTIIFSIPAGISFATCIYIGNMMGKNNVGTAKIYAYSAVISVFLCISLLSFFIILNKSNIPYIYTNDLKEAETFSNLIPLLVCFAVFDAIQLTLNGILKGLGKVKLASFLALIILYPINVPLSLTMAFTLNYKLTGLWYSQLTAIIFLSFSYLIMIICLDWTNNAKRTIINIKIISDKLLNKAKKLEGVLTKIN